MRIATWLAAGACLGLAGGCAPAPTAWADTQAVDAATLRAAARTFHDDLAGGRVNEVVASLQMARPGAWEREVRRFYAGMSISMVRKRQDFAVLDAKVRNGCGVVVINEFEKFDRSAFDLDPLYFVRRDGRWRLLARGNRYRDLIHDLTSLELADFSLLEQWYLARAADLTEEHAATSQPAR